VQLFTFVFYGLAIIGLWMHRGREPLLPGAGAPVEKRELRLLRVLFAVVLALGLALSPFRQNALLYPPLVLNFITWSLLGFFLTALSLAKGVREFSESAGPPPGIPKVKDPVQ
jgi:amino acid transporter